MIISTEFNSDDSTLMISYYDETGNIAFIKKPIQSADLFNWMLTPNPTEFRNWDNRYLKKAQNKWLNRFRLEELTQTRLTPDELAKVYSDLSPKKYYLDIEIQLTSQDFPDPAKALMPVNLITFVNEDNVCFVLSTMKDLSNKTVSTMQDEVNDYFKAHSQIFSIKYVYFEKEEDMLNMFFHKALPKIPFSVITSTSTEETKGNGIIKNILSAMITSLLAWFILEQFEINSLYKALIYGLAGLNSPEILKGILKITTSFSNNPGEFISNIKSGKIETPPKRTTRTVNKPVRKTINRK